VTALGLVTKCRQALYAGKRSMSPASRAVILASLSEAEKRLTGQGAATRNEAVSLALQDFDVKQQSRALMRIATAAVRSGAPEKEMKQPLALVRDTTALREELPTLVTALADAAAVAKAS